MRERTELDDRLSSLVKIEKDLTETLELAEMGEADGDVSIVDEAQSALADLKQDVTRRQFEALFAGEADTNDTYIEINSGAGGTESQDWANMLLRMYTRWAERHRFKVELMDFTDGETAGIKSATILVKGEKAYGWSKVESGVHRLVRISPFDSNARRHTSFASVWVYPVIDDSINIEIKESDCRIDTYRASGAGGQHVNRTDSAVRITHLPSGIVVACQQDRSQHKNRATAWGMLKARLYEAELKTPGGGCDGDARLEVGHRLGPPDPLLRPAALPAREGSAHGRRPPEPRPTSSTATSTSSCRRRSRSASMAAARAPWRTSISRP